MILLQEMRLPVLKGEIVDEVDVKAVPAELRERIPELSKPVGDPVWCDEFLPLMMNLSCGKSLLPGQSLFAMIVAIERTTSKKFIP